MESAERPRLRADLEFAAAEAEAEGGPLLLVHDPQAVAVEVVQLGLGALAILERLDGSRTLEDLRLEFLNAGAGVVALDDLRAFVETLDRCCFLEGGSYEAEISSRAEFVTAPVRPAAHAGAAYPEEPAEARRFLDGMLALAPSAPGAPVHREAPVYPQLWGEFRPNLSVVDLLLICGPKGTHLIRPAGRLIPP